ncbi:MAG: class I SAM-dependent methyltransferase [Oscillospiraceae bacterium]|nr:class I SAM-dependent methyltransferase [Oscillospiraceae bacterium]
MATKNLYENTAYLYDFDNRDLLNDDVKIALECVEKTKGDILEIACGTGRVTIPVLKKAIDRNVTAFDLSDTMLSVFREKAAKLPDEITKNLSIENANMTIFNLNKTFGLVILIWRAFQVLLNESDAVQCLKNIKKHMNDDSLFLFSVFIPRQSYGDDWLGKETEAYITVDPATNNKIRRYTKNIKSDQEKQIIEYVSIYEITAPDGRFETIEDNITYRYYTPEQIKSLLIKCGFTIIEESSNSTDIFLVLRKK